MLRTMKIYQVLRAFKDKIAIGVFILALLPATVLSSTTAFADPNILLGNAISKSLQLDGSLPTKERLKVYEKIFDLLDQITIEHPSSEQAIKIISRQTIGEFNPSLLKDDYVNELSDYYDIVCEKSPSFSCLGFVSLKTGRQQCEGANTLETIVEAHRNIKNAARVFIGQEEKSAYISLALNEYKDCLSKSNFERTDYATDFFASETLDLFLQIGNEDRAKATIENMITPAFKFAGVLKLYENQGKEFSQDFFDRMDGYIREKIAKDENAALSAIRLADAATRLAEFKVDYGLTYGAVQTYRGWGLYGSSCYPFFSKNLFTILTEYQKNIIKMPEGRNDVGNDPSLMSSIAERARGPLGVCKQDPNVTIEKSDGGEKYSADVSPSAQNGAYYDYYLMTSIHGQLLSFRPEKAAEFRRRAIDEYWSQKQQISFVINAVADSLDALMYFVEFQDPFETSEFEGEDMHDKLDRLGIEMIDLKPSEMGKLMKGECLERFEDCSDEEPAAQWVAPDLQNAYIRQFFTHPLARSIVFEKMVDFEAVCEASEILFQELKGTDAYDHAIEYMITSPSIDPDQKYECGDEDLELLLN